MAKWNKVTADLWKYGLVRFVIVPIAYVIGVGGILLAALLIIVLVLAMMSEILGLLV